MAEHKFGEIVEQRIASWVIDGEWVTGRQNASDDDSDFESYIDLLECERTEKEYDWKSDIFIPEFLSQVLTETAGDAELMFKSRDFFEVYLQDPKEPTVLSVEAAKECVNRTLNQKHIYFYNKYIRSKTVANLVGEVLGICQWEQKVKIELQGSEVDENGDEQPIVEEKLLKDRFNMDVVDPRNVAMSPEYVYSIQDKKWVQIRCEKTLAELNDDAEFMGYFNLGLLKKTDNSAKSSGETDTARESYNSRMNKVIASQEGSPSFDIVQRFGKFPFVRRGGKIVPGIDENGELLEGYEFEEMIVTHAIQKNKRVLIRFQLQPYTDHEGNRIKPLIRGLCYVHPTKDGGLGDGKAGRELSIGINDTFNLTQDRTLAATLPILMGNVDDNEDNFQDWYIQPEHIIPFSGERPPEVLQITDNIQGGIQQIDFLTNKSQQVKGIFPNTMGQMPAHSSTTATAIAGSEANATKRENYKQLTYDNTFLYDLANMILMMTEQYAKEETAFKLMGDKWEDWNPALDYTFRPIGQNIESEHSKTNKINQLIQMLQALMQSPNAKAPAMANLVLVKILKLQGDDQMDVAAGLMDESQPLAQGAEPAQGQVGGGASNQYGVQQGLLEQNARS